MGRKQTGALIAANQEKSVEHPPMRIDVSLGQIT